MFGNSGGVGGKGLERRLAAGASVWTCWASLGVFPTLRHLAGVGRGKLRTGLLGLGTGQHPGHESITDSNLVTPYSIPICPTGW